LVAVEALLANWMAPEVLRNRKFQQASDIYSLGSVMWEIISGQLPFDGDSQVEIRQKILSGYRHPIPPYYKGSAIAALITRCWHEEPSRRPLGEEVVSELEHILSDQCYGLMGEVESAPNTTALRDFYEQHFRQSNASSVYSDGQHGHRPSISFTSIFSRFNPTTTVQGDRQQESTERSSASHTSTDSSVNDLSTPLIVGGGEMDTIAMAQRKHSHGGNRFSNERTKSDTDTERRKHRESKSYFSNNMYSLRMQAQMPRAALDAIGLVRVCTQV
jgi:serine/threonine protein kinase